MDKSKRINILNKDGFSSIYINDIACLYEKMKNDNKVGDGYKKMPLWKFIEWIDAGLTPRQFKKLQSLNDSFI